MAISLSNVVYDLGRPVTALGSCVRSVKNIDAHISAANMCIEPTAVDCGAVQNQWYTVESWNGKGIIAFCALFAPGITGANYQGRMEIDGTEVWLSATNCWNATGDFGDGVVLVGGHDHPGSGASSPIFSAVPVYSNVTLQVRCTSTGLAEGFNRHIVIYTYA